jgi:hypothetical protein
MNYSLIDADPMFAETSAQSADLSEEKTTSFFHKIAFIKLKIIEVLVVCCPEKYMIVPIRVP